MAHPNEGPQRPSDLPAGPRVPLEGPGIPGLGILVVLGLQERPFGANL